MVSRYTCLKKAAKNACFERKKKETEINAQREKIKSGADPATGFSGLAFGLFDIPVTKAYKASDIALVARRNVYFLYHDPSRLAFPSPEDEVIFWSKPGISRTVPRERIRVSRYPWFFTFKEARNIVRDKKGDLIIALQESEFEVRELHSCFSIHRERVRALSLSLTEPPIKK